MTENRATRVAKLAGRFANLQRALRKEGLNEVADKMAGASMLLVKHGLDEYKREYGTEERVP